MLDPLISFDRIDNDELNRCLVDWKHKMGPLQRPQYVEGIAHGMRHDGRLVAVTATEQMIPAETCGMRRDEAFELARVCAARPDICRVAVRLWREFVFPAVSLAWECPWSISYQDAAAHRGDLYRFDGWVRLGCTRSGTDRRAIGGERRGRNKVVWGWTLDAEKMAEKRELAAKIDWPRWAKVAA